MKLVKNTQFGEITTSLDGILYIITQEGVTVSDEVASVMKGQFLHTIEVSDLEQPKQEIETPKEEVSDTEESEEKPKKRGRPAKVKEE